MPRAQREPRNRARFTAITYPKQRSPHRIVFSTGHFHIANEGGSSFSSFSAVGRKTSRANGLFITVSSIQFFHFPSSQPGNGVGKLILGRQASRFGIIREATDRSSRLERRLPRYASSVEDNQGLGSLAQTSILK